MFEVSSNKDTAQISRAISLARSLLKKGGALESTTEGESIDRTKLALALEEQIFSQLSHNAELPAVTAKAAAAEGLLNAENALNKIAPGTSPANLTDLEVASLEAIIEITGRPAMRYENGNVGMPSALGENEHWRVLIATARNDINLASAAVGRIMITGLSGLPENIGTGWRLGQDLLVTNRHVGLLMVKKPDSRPPDLTLDEARHPFIDFSATDNATTTKRFDIAALVYCAAEEFVDVAILKVKSGLADLPAALTLDWNPDSLGSKREDSNGAGSEFMGKEVYVVGHPFKQRRSQAIAAVFGTADGLKRWSPGLIKRIHRNEPILEHDCSTLGGNSGSCVLSAEEHAVIGIHMGGFEVDELTDRGLANAAVAFSYLGQHPVAEILRAGIV